MSALFKVLCEKCKLNLTFDVLVELFSIYLIIKVTVQFEKCFQLMEHISVIS